MIVEHLPWKGPLYQSGLGGVRVAIIGYSHHRKPEEPDHSNWTIDMMLGVASGTRRDKFFVKVQDYFGRPNQPNFWNQVLFFNYLTDCVIDFFGTGQTGPANNRFKKIISTYLPDKVFVFSRKAWNGLSEEAESPPAQPLGMGLPHTFQSRIYKVNQRVVAAYGLKHPQYAKRDLMRRAVSQILALPLASGADHRI